MRGFSTGTAAWPRRQVPAFVLALALLGSAGLVGGCAGGATTAEEPAFGSREEPVDESRETLLITPPADDAEEFFYYPAYFSDVEVRRGTFANGRRPVELLIRGALPDGCTALHYIGQSRLGNIIDVTFEMRKPKGAVCTQVVRPYRFYYDLEEPLPPGDYTLRINDEVHPFTVQPRREEG